MLIRPSVGRRLQDRDPEDLANDSRTDRSNRTHPTKPGGIIAGVTDLVRPPHAGPDPGRLVADQLRHRLKHAGGFTLHPETNEQPGTGFAVCTDRQLSKHIAWDSWDDRLVARWLHSLSDELRRGSSFLGGWLERSHGRAWLEVVVVVPADQFVFALHLASRARQQAVYDLGTRTVVPVSVGAAIP